MKKRQHEKGFLPDTSYDETTHSLVAQAQSSREVSTNPFPCASATDLEASYTKIRPLQVEMFGTARKKKKKITCLLEMRKSNNG